MSFPSRSSGGTDGLLPQHLKDLIGPAAEDGAESVLNGLTALITLILEGGTLAAACSLLFDLRRKWWHSSNCRGRLASKCACLHASNSIPGILASYQLGFEIRSGVEAAVHATRVYLHNLTSN